MERRKQDAIFIYLLDQNQIPSLRGRCPPTPRNEIRRREQVSEKNEEKGIEVQRGKPLTIIHAIDALRGEEKQIEKRKKR